MSARRGDVGKTKRSVHGMPIGEHHHAAKLTERRVLWLRRMNKRGMCIKCCAALLGVSYCAAWEAANYGTWKHVE